MLVFDKTEIKENLTTDNVFELLQIWGGDPIATAFGIISATICHNAPGEGSHKLYYYENSGLFHCYTGCQGTFDIFELTIKVFKIQYNNDMDLNDAVRFIASKFHMSGRLDNNDTTELNDWKILANYDRIEDISLGEQHILLKEYDIGILENFNYNCSIEPWLRDNIAAEVMHNARIGFYPGEDQITIPHFDIDNRFIGLRGRTLIKDTAEYLGKYRPIKVNGELYNHPLGMNLYNLNHSKDKIKLFGKAIVFESEKSTLQYRSYFGDDVDISVACCGSSISNYQMHLLLGAGAKEIIIAFDRQFQKIGDDEFHHLVLNLQKISKKYCNFATISFIFDKSMITSYKASPVDEGKEKFLQLFKERIIL